MGRFEDSTVESALGNGNPAIAHADLSVQNEGTIFLLTPISDAGREWIAEKLCTEDALWFGGALCVEHRFIADIVTGAQEDGLCVI